MLEQKPISIANLQRIIKFLNEHFEALPNQQKGLTYMISKFRWAIKALLVGLVRIYQIAISPLLGNNCRFYPSCSSYMIQAIEEHGILKGLWLGTVRLLKCGPWHEGGMDPVPERKNQCDCHTKSKLDS